MLHRAVRSHSSSWSGVPVQDANPRARGWEGAGGSAHAGGSTQLPPGSVAAAGPGRSRAAPCRALGPAAGASFPGSTKLGAELTHESVLICYQGNESASAGKSGIE